MFGRRNFDEAIRNGERNRDAIPLVRNWCANARIVAQGYGLVARQLRLPIGHHAIECDFAADGSTSYHYELSEAAVDFHARNCVGCDKRTGGRLPNLMQFVAARERQRERREGEENRAKAVADAALAARDDRRRVLRAALSPVAQVLVDDIGALDHGRTRENLDRLMRSAEMAPHHFSPPLVEYILEVCEGSDWLDEPGLTMLAAVGADPRRLAAIAARAVAGGRHAALAAGVLAPLIHHLDEAAAENAAPGAMELANPDRRPSFGRSEPTADPLLLEALYERRPAAVARAAERLLGTRRAHGAELAARGLLALLPGHPGAATPHLRSLVSVFVRADRLLDDFDEFGGSLGHVADAVVGAFDADPSGTDGLLQEYCEGASAQRARVGAVSLMRTALRPMQFA